MLINYLIILFFILGFHSAYTQTDSTNSFTLKGTIVNGDDNTLLIGANILINKSYATNTDNNGEFTIQVNGNDSIIISYIGFKSLLYLIQPHEKGNYLTKLKLYKDSISLKEIEIFPYPTYKEFQEAFLTMDKQDEQIKMAGVKLYQDRIIHETYDMGLLNLFTNPISFMYDKLFDKKAKLNRKLERRTNTINKETMISD